MHKRKLIEVALPLEAINRESTREKSIRHGHPSTLHLWWARRPLAAARAVLFAQLVDDPSARPEEFPTEESQRRERERLHKLIERLVVWENVRDEKLLADAHAEILKSTDGNPPPILDPFAGGGTIPLEAQRLGLKAHASDLNPVAVLINKALIEIPPRFRDQPPIFPGLAKSEIRTWKGAEGLAADVRAYGAWMRDQAEKQIGHLYPRAVLSDGSEATSIAWIWARTVVCPNPACGIELPLVASWWLGKKQGKEAYVVPETVVDATHPSGRRVRFEVGHDSAGPRIAATKSGRGGATCLECASPVSKAHIKAEGVAGRMGAALMAIVAEGRRQRVYTAPTDAQVAAATVDRPEDIPSGDVGNDPRALWTPLYGLTRIADLFTNRQLLMLGTLADLVAAARRRAMSDGADSDYADAVAVYLALAISRMSDRHSSLTTWDSGPKKEYERSVFSRHAVQMSWDFVESNPLGTAGASVHASLSWLAKALERLPAIGDAVAEQADAAARNYEGFAVSTDPPYYDNIGYSDLSDLFYVWLRRALRPVEPTLFATLVAPKDQELVANPYRQGGREGARTFFESGFRSVFARIRETANADVPMTVWYAFKQSELDHEGQASTGWETMLEGMIGTGWEITSTWPNRSEMANRMISIGTNALASSIVLSLRPRAENASTIDRRGFISTLESELPDALRKLQQGQIAPVDLPQAAIGPGMAVFSRFSAVLEPDGSKMTVRSALSRINEILDQVLNEQEGDFDSTSRFAIAWYRQHGYGVGRFGDADNLARARNTSVDMMDRDEILTSRAGNVQLIKPADLPWDYDALKDARTSNWEALHHLIKVLERDGIAPAGDLLQAAMSRPDGAIDADLVKELAHLLFRIAEGNGWTKDALSFNTLVTTWPEIRVVAQSVKTSLAQQGAFEFDDGDE